ncbi:hypothetical protein SARC_08846 [Sphaeroforma arctica JP610]|uniref:Uncharacterized protein n=1 Tax=Sphaeroforma arctica JP610 TaxID=667725 RepID=A0A0L0FPU6_9EUKA|nr:hypothetical protein SARC_08846 [Sphaeroforma arctica JP610]KNC78734.1 hypothetical protein SARC_08846 [Sphaeroforma arctica JP610]|eukprot:XP_014152636.1 hypothetical protein SARC_08846 [Sphaeroforma arctica JP610]
MVLRLELLSSEDGTAAAGDTRGVKGRGGVVTSGEVAAGSSVGDGVGVWNTASVSSFGDVRLLESRAGAGRVSWWHRSGLLRHTMALGLVSVAPHRMRYTSVYEMGTNVVFAMGRVDQSDVHGTLTPVTDNVLVGNKSAGDPTRGNYGEKIVYLMVGNTLVR